MILSKSKIIKFFKRIKFKCIVLSRAFLVLFKRKKSIQLIQLDYHTKYIFERSYFAIAYEFKNALWFEFNGIKTTNNHSIALFNRNKTENPIQLTVHGLFNKQVFVIDISHDTILENTSFLTGLNNLSSYKYISKNLKLDLSIPLFISKDISFNVKPEIMNKKLKIIHNQFNQSNYI